jgi:hypothetical protein
MLWSLSRTSQALREFINAQVPWRDSKGLVYSNVWAGRALLLLDSEFSPLLSQIGMVFGSSEERLPLQSRTTCTLRVCFPRRRPWRHLWPLALVYHKAIISIVSFLKFRGSSNACRKKRYKKYRLLRALNSSNISKGANNILVFYYCCGNPNTPISSCWVIP